MVENYHIDLHRILHKILPKLEGEIKDETNLFDVGLDSLKAVEFVLEIEEQYGIYFDLEEITYDGFKTIKSISELIQRKNYIYSEYTKDL